MSGAPSKRYDFAEVTAYLREHSAHVPAVQLDTFTGYWCMGESIARLADWDGVSRAAVKKRIIRLRHRVRRWIARRQPQRTR